MLAAHDASKNLNTLSTHCPGTFLWSRVPAERMQPLLSRDQGLGEGSSKGFWETHQ